MKVNNVKSVNKAIKIDAKMAGRGAEFFFADSDFDGHTVKINIGSIVSEKIHMPTALNESIKELEEIIKDLREFEKAIPKIKSTFVLYE